LDVPPGGPTQVIIRYPSGVLVIGHLSPAIGIIGEDPSKTSLKQWYLGQPFLNTKFHKESDGVGIPKSISQGNIDTRVPNNLPEHVWNLTKHFL